MQIQMEMNFDGSTFDEEKDGIRLGKQLKAVYGLMKDCKWRSLYQISKELGKGNPEQSVSARIRDLRKDKFGGHIVERRRKTDATWEYCLKP